MKHILCLAIGIASLFAPVSAHTQIYYPEWRGNSFIPPFNQRIYPCAGFNDNSTTPRTLWPLDGGSFNVTLHDAAAYLFINIGFGLNATDFNITLFDAPLNETGAGGLCIPKLTLPSGLPIEEGTNATIQFATAGHDGGGLYNCADITFSKNASLLPASECRNSSTVTVSTLTSEPESSTNSSTASSSAASSSPTSGAGHIAPSLLLLFVISVLAISL